MLLYEHRCSELLSREQDPQPLSINTHDLNSKLYTQEDVPRLDKTFARTILDTQTLQSVCPFHKPRVELGTVSNYLHGIANQPYGLKQQ